MLLKKVILILSVIATIIGTIVGVINLYDRFTQKPVWEQSIPLDELEKYRKGDGNIRIEKGITITPEENSDE